MIDFDINHLLKEFSFNLVNTRAGDNNFKVRVGNDVYTPADCDMSDYPAFTRCQLKSDMNPGFVMPKFYSVSGARNIAIYRAVDAMLLYPEIREVTMNGKVTTFGLTKAAIAKGHANGGYSVTLKGMTFPSTKKGMMITIGEWTTVSENDITFNSKGSITFKMPKLDTQLDDN